MAVIELKRDEAKQLLQKQLLRDKYKVSKDCTNAIEYSDTEITKILCSMDKNNKYVIKEHIEKEEKDILEEIAKLQAML